MTEHRVHPDYERFLVWKGRRTKASTINTMRRRFARFPDPDDLTLDYFESRMDAVSPRTVKYELIMAKAFLKWAKRDHSHLDGYDVGKLEETVTVDDLYTPDELSRIFSAAEPTRDRPMLQVLFESACRAGEIVSMTYEQVRPGEVPNTFEVLVDGKTGKREVVLIDSAPALKIWLEAHPTKTGPLWISAKRGENGAYRALSETGLYLVVQKYLSRAGISGKRRIVHMFRHTRITNMHREGWQGLSLHRAVGWAPGSAMEKTYIHLDGSEVKSRWYQARGLKSENGQTARHETPVVCDRCKTPNDYTRKFCSECGFPLTEELRSKFQREDILARLEEYKRLVIDMDERIKEIKEENQDNKRANQELSEFLHEMKALIEMKKKDKKG